MYAYKGAWVFGKYPFLYLPHGLSMGIYKNYIPMMGMRWGWVFDKFTSAGSNYVYPGVIPGGGLEIFLAPAPYWWVPNKYKE